MTLVVADTSVILNLCCIGRQSLRTLGILGILLRAKAKCTIQNVSDEIAKLETMAGFWVHPRIKQQTLDKALE